MFCHKCGAQIAEGAAFCHKCGTKVVYADTVLQSSAFIESSSVDDKNVHQQQNDRPESGGNIPGVLSVTLISVESAYKVRTIKEVCDLTGLGLAESRRLVENVPALLKKDVAQEKAEAIKASFMKAGSKVNFIDQTGASVRVDLHCKQCGAILDDENDLCPACGHPAGILPEDHPSPTQKSVNDLELNSLWEQFKAIPMLGKVLISFGLCFSILILFVILRLIFSSIISVIATVAIGCFVYQCWGADYITQYIYNKRGHDLQLPEGMDAQGLIESLSGKFNYPYFKGIRYDTEGKCLIEGRYAVYPVKFIGENSVELSCQIGAKNEKRRTILREAIAIRSYVNKFFNPALPFDAAKDLKALKFTEMQRKVVIFIDVAATILIAIIIGVEYVFPGGLQRIIQPGIEVRGAYLSQYSEEVTIEEAFDNFFGNEKWSTYESEGYSYIVFTGVCEYMEELADVRITFKVTGEKFRVEGLDINGEEQNDLVLALMLAKVYEEY